jgi:hypothetical protein
MAYPGGASCRQLQCSPDRRSDSEGHDTHIRHVQAVPAAQLIFQEFAPTTAHGDAFLIETAAPDGLSGTFTLVLNIERHS